MHLAGRLGEWWRRIIGVERTRREVADLIEGFVDKTGGDTDWDDLTSIPIVDRELNAIRNELIWIENHHHGDGTHIDEQGIDRLRAIIERLRRAG